MFSLIKKDLLLYVLITIPSQLILSLVWLLVFRDLNVAVVLIQTMFVFFAVVVVTSHSEQVEETNNGYRFLRNLPVTTLEIVGAKFILILSTITFLGFCNILLFTLFQSEPKDLKICIAAMIFTCCGALLFSALVNIGIFILGADNFMRVTSALVLVMVVIFMIYFKGVKLDVNVVAERVMSFINEGGLLFYIILTLILYLGLMGVAVFARKSGRQVKDLTN